MLLVYLMIIAHGMRVLGTATKPHASLEVTGCNNERLALYGDPHFKNALPNPFFADTRGYFDFYAKAKCIEVEE